MNQQTHRGQERMTEMTHQSNQVQEKLQDVTTRLVIIETKVIPGNTTRPLLPVNIPINQETRNQENRIVTIKKLRIQ